MKRKKQKSELILITMKIGDWDLDQVKRKAEKHSEGNLSAWIRYAARMYTPKKGERITLKAS